MTTQTATVTLRFRRQSSITIGTAVCLFHEDDSGTLYIYHEVAREIAGFHCFGCGTRGSAVRRDSNYLLTAEVV
jgi:DNA primase